MLSLDSNCNNKIIFMSSSSGNLDNDKSGIITKIPGVEDIKAILQKHLRIRNPRPIEEFSATAVKPDGMTAGYVASSADQNTQYLIKYAPISPTAPPADAPDAVHLQYNKDCMNRLDLMTELITSNVWNLLLYNRAPNIGVVVGQPQLDDQGISLSRTTSSSDPTIFIPEVGSSSTDDEGVLSRVTSAAISLSETASQKDDVVSLRSEFFKDFQTLSALSGTPQNAKEPEITNVAKLQNLIGFEKVIAACLFLGETDYHSGNLGVVKGENGENIVVKIDHGKSGNYGPRIDTETVSTLINKLCANMTIYYPGMPLDTQKLKESIDQMAQITDEEIARIVDKQIAELQSITSGKMDATEITIPLSLATPNSPTDEVDLSKIKEGFIARRKTMQALSKELDVMLKMTPPLNGLLDAEGESPIVWAIRQRPRRMIDSKDPLTWAIENKHKIDGKDPVAWAIENNHNIGGIRPLAWATTEEGCTIDGKDPLIWILNNIKTTAGTPILEWVEERLLTMSNKQSPQVYFNSPATPADLAEAIEQNSLIRGKPVIEYCKEQGIELLPIIIDRYKVGDLERNQKLAKAYNELLGKSDKEQPTTAAFDDAKDVATAISSAQSQIARTSLTIKDVAHHCSLETLHKMTRVGRCLSDTKSGNLSDSAALETFINKINYIDILKIQEPLRSAVVGLQTPEAIEVRKTIAHARQARRASRSLSMHLPTHKGSISSGHSKKP